MKLSEQGSNLLVSLELVNNRHEVVSVGNDCLLDHSQVLAFVILCLFFRIKECTVIFKIPFQISGEAFMQGEG